VIYEHPLAYLLGLEGVALMCGFIGEYDRGFVEARPGEMRPRPWPRRAPSSGSQRSRAVTSGRPVGRRAAARTADGWAEEAFQARDRRATSGHERPDRSGQQQSPSIDLGTLRFDAAINFGPPAAAEVLVGWRRATGRAADAMAYWDLVAALTTPPDMTQWLSVAHDHGRVDLDAATLNNRRDTFLRSALDQL
jgi:hypothetical protein